MGAISHRRWSIARDRSAALAERWRRYPERVMLGQLFEAVDLAAAQSRAAILLGDGDWLGRWLDPLVAALANDPLVDPPLKVMRDVSRLSAVLYDGPSVRLTASVLSARALAQPARVVLSGRVAVTRYHHASGACVRRWRLDQRSDRLIALPQLWPGDGAVVIHDGRHEAYAIIAAARDIVTITLTLRAGAAQMIREFDAESGVLRRSATADETASRDAMLLTLLRVSGRNDAADVFAQATHEAAGHVRWSAMREWLALDAHAALPRLVEMADADPEADVRRAATATLARAHARLAPCPA